MDPEKLSEKTDPSYEIKYIDISSVSLEEGVKEKQIYAFEESPSRARRKLLPGDTIISTVRTYLRAIAFIEIPESNWIASTGFCVLRPSNDIEPKFLYRVVQSKPFVDAVVACSEGVSYPAINPSTLGRIEVPLPEKSQQKAIVDYVDGEIAKIDDLVYNLGGYEAARQSGGGSFLSLIVEKRTSLITSAVTGQIDVGAVSNPRRSGRISSNVKKQMEAGV